MTTRIIELPLYEDADYYYTASLERTSYKIRLYYNERMQQWIMDLRYSDNTPVILGQAVVIEYPMFVDYQKELTGFFWVSPIGASQNETVSNPFELSKYYKFYYVWEE